MRSFSFRRVVASALVVIGFVLGTALPTFAQDNQDPVLDVRNGDNQVVRIDHGALEINVGGHHISVGDGQVVVKNDGDQPKPDDRGIIHDGHDKPKKDGHDQPKNNDHGGNPPPPTTGNPGDNSSPPPSVTPPTAQPVSNSGSSGSSGGSGKTCPTPVADLVPDLLPQSMWGLIQYDPALMATTCDQFRLRPIFNELAQKLADQLAANVASAPVEPAPVAESLAVPATNVEATLPTADVPMEAAAPEGQQAAAAPAAEPSSEVTTDKAVTDEGSAPEAPQVVQAGS